MDKQSSGRIAAIDILRGMTILGMVLCAQIGWDSGLPAWMFHAQLPPPDYKFSPDVPGITWVDLVFPFFLFSMGAAFPFSLRKKLERGETHLKVISGLVKRWIILLLFSIVLGNGSLINSADTPVYVKSMFLWATWAGMFLSLTRFRVEKGSTAAILNASGVVFLIILAILEASLYGIGFSINRVNIIITVLANISLAGGLVWLLTKDRILWRCGVLVVVLTLKALSMYSDLMDWVPSFGTSLFAFDYLKYLGIAIPGSIVGDMLMKDREASGVNRNTVETIAAVLTSAAVIFQLWGMFTRHVLVDFVISAVLAAVVFVLTRKNRSLWSDIVLTGFVLMLCGIAADPLEGGIRKDPSNISYFLTTGGMAAMTTGVFLFFERSYGFKGKILASCGQNPMIAYTATAFLINPLLSVTGLMAPLNSLTPGSPFWGVMRGVLIMAAVALVTNLFTRFKIYWRS